VARLDRAAAHKKKRAMIYLFLGQQVRGLIANRETKRQLCVYEITTHSCAENGDAYSAAMTRRVISQLF
jgi:hypothetical protein